MADNNHPNSRELDELDARISSARKGLAEETNTPAKSEVPQSLVGLAMRAGVELVAGVAVGAGVSQGAGLMLGAALLGMFALATIAGFKKNKASATHKKS